MAADIPAQLRFLTDAGHLLAATAPETSAFMLSERNELIRGQGLEVSDMQKQQVCGRCGHKLMPGVGHDSLELKSKAKGLSTSRGMKAQKRHPSAKNQERHAPQATSSPGTSRQSQQPKTTKILTCGLCSYETRVVLEPSSFTTIRRPRSKALQKVSTTTTGLKPVDDTSITLERPIANASSKKRARNKKQGLQALLNQSQGASSGRGFSLADFAKK